MVSKLNFQYVITVHLALIIRNISLEMLTWKFVCPAGILEMWMQKLFGFWI